MGPDKLAYGFYEGNYITREEAKELVGPGWSGLIDKIWDGLTPNVLIEQIKEKFGGLRFYAGYTDDIQDLIIRLAEKESYTICERCGKPGKTRDLPWVLTLCAEHYREELVRLRDGHIYGNDSG